MNQESILKAAAEAAMQAQNPDMMAQQQQVIPPQPVPMTVQMSTTQDMQGNKFVVLLINHPTGQSVYHFTPEGAEQIADGLKQTASLSKTGLQIAR